MKYYVVIPVAEITQAQLNASLERDLSRARKTSDGTQAILELIVDRPPFPSAFEDRVVYTEAEIHTELQSEAWVAVSEEAQPAGIIETVKAFIFG